jgi:hypothetical protein
MNPLVAWLLIGGASALILLLIWALLRVAALADAVCPAKLPAQVRSHRGRDGVLRSYMVVRAEWDASQRAAHLLHVLSILRMAVRAEADEWHPG